MDLSYLQEFLTFSQYMNVSRAAQKLHMAQPTLSHHIAAIEQEVGVQLVNRTSPMTLTGPGRVFVDGGFELIKAYEGLLGAVRDADTTVLDLNIALNMSETAPHRTLTARCYQFREEKPDFFVHYHESKYATAAESLQNEKVDCVAVFICPIPSDLEAGIVYKRVPMLYPNKLLISFDRQHPLASRPSVKWADMAGMSTLVADNYFKLWVTTTRLMLEGHIPDLKVRLSTQDVQGHLQALQVNDIHLYDETCKDLMVVKMNTRRVNVPLDEPDAVSECYIAYKPEHVSPALQIFLDFLDTCEDGVI